MIGYVIQQELGNELPVRAPPGDAADDDRGRRRRPRLRDPTKPIGPLYDARRGRRAGGREGLDVQAGRRQAAPCRAVAAPEADLRDRGDQVAARERLRRDLRGRRRHPDHLHGRAGAGRAAARRRRGRDRQGSRQRAARGSTSGPTCSRSSPTSTPSTRDWGTPEQQPIRRATPAELAGAEFAEGSMGPKVSAACQFVERTGKRAVIGSIADTPALVRGEAGTVVETSSRTPPEPAHRVPPPEEELADLGGDDDRPRGEDADDPLLPGQADRAEDAVEDPELGAEQDRDRRQRRSPSAACRSANVSIGEDRAAARP